MHASSIENMRKCYDRYLLPSAVGRKSQLRVLDVGAADVNGSYRNVFASPRIEYLTADLDSSPGVDIVMADPYEIPLGDCSVDVVVSGQMLEHCEFFWLSFAEMVRVLAPDGLLFLVAPSAGPIHRFPVDCYRFYPDAYRALARHSGCYLVDVWLDERGPWRDLTGVFAKREVPKYDPGTRAGAPQETFSNMRGAPEEEAVSGSVEYLAFLSRLHRDLRPDLYLEIGVRGGASLALASCHAVGIDPSPDVNESALASTTRIFRSSSDDFFEFDAARALATPIDLALIDGMHLFEYALRDFMNIECHSHPGTLVVVDDIFPGHVAQAERTRRTRAWMGDVWKLHACLSEHRPDLILLPVDTYPSGMLLIAGLDASNRTLWDRYNPVVRSLSANRDPPQPVIERRGALQPGDGRIAELVSRLRDLRAEQH